MKKILAMGALVLSSFGMSAQAEIVSTSNLLKNSEFLSLGTDNPSSDWAVASGVDEWSVHSGTPRFRTTGSATILSYSEDYTDGDTIRYFRGHTSGSYAAATQRITLTENYINTSLVDTGVVKFQFGAFMWTHNVDDARMRVFAKDADGVTLTYSVLGYYQNSSLHRYESSWVDLPAQTRYLDVYLESERDYGTENNGYIAMPTVYLGVDNEDVNTISMMNQVGGIAVPVQGALGVLLVGGLFGFAGQRSRRA